MRLQGHVVALGDSYCAGTPTIEPWTAVLAREHLEAASFANVARMHATVAEVLAQQLEAALEGEPDLLICCVGINDLVSGTEFEELQAGLDRLFEALAGGAPEAVLMTATYPDVSPFLADAGPGMRRRIRRGITAVNASLVDVATAHGAVVADAARLPQAGQRDFYDADGWHASGSAQRIFAAHAAALLGAVSA